MIDLSKLTLNDLKSDKEKLAFPIALIFSLMIWAALALTLVAILYIVAGAIFFAIVHLLYLAHIRGNGVKISERQFPDLHARVVKASERLGHHRRVDAYVMQEGGLLNAMATKFLARRFIIIYSDLVEACDEDDAALDFVVGHEVAHLALGHLSWRFALWPAQMIPLLGPALSRAYEYSCDRCGLAVAGDLEGAQRGLAILAAGKKLGRSMSLEAFMDQRLESGEFWLAVYELMGTHPYLPKRMAAIQEMMQPGTAPAPGRNILAYPLAPFLGAPLGAVGGAGGAGGFLMIVAVIGILAAIAIPNFLKFQARARQSEAKAILKSCYAAQEEYHRQHGRFAVGLEQLELRGETPLRYTLFMGETYLGDEIDVEEEYRGFANDYDYLCTAVGNIDGDSVLDVWEISPERGGPEIVVNDIHLSY